jgi:CHAD domain-containing protein
MSIQEETPPRDPNTVPFKEAMVELIGERWEEVWKVVPVAVEGVDPEGVHDVRVASRRLRAAMDVAVDAFDTEWYRNLHKLAKQITSELGEVRDRDVLLEAFRADRDAAPAAEWPGIDLVINRVDRERVAARAEMEEFLGKLEKNNAAAETARRFNPAAPAPKRGKKGNEVEPK